MSKSTALEKTIGMCDTSVDFQCSSEEEHGRGEPIPDRESWLTQAGVAESRPAAGRGSVNSQRKMANTVPRRGTTSTHTGGLMKHRYTQEILFHYICGNCLKWWSVSTLAPAEHVSCPHCATTYATEEKV